MTRDVHDPHHHTIAPPPDDGREARDLSPGENANLCAGCVKCCTYVTIEIDPPRAAWEYDQWIWALHHAGIQLYVERPEKWFLHLETRCRRLDGNGRCSIYGRHPVLCRDYDPRGCERRYPLTEVRAWFREAGELETWIARERPAHWRTLLRFRRDFTPAPSRPSAPALAAGFIALDRIGQGAPAAPSGGRRAPALARRAR
jgi:hypothetical protein